MAEILCIVCNRMNEAGAERCWFCGAVLPAADWSLHPEDGVKESDQIPAPAADQEQAVPEWLARIRARQRQERGEVIEEPQADAEEQPSAEQDGESVEAASESVQVGSPDEPRAEEIDQSLQSTGQKEEELPAAIRDYQVAAAIEPEEGEDTDNDQGAFVPDAPEVEHPVATNEELSPDGLPAWHAARDLPDDDSKSDDNLQPGVTSGLGQELVVTVQQRESVELFRLLQESPHPAQVRRDKQTVGRWLPYTLLGVVFLLAILVPRLFPANAVFTSTWFPREVVSTYQIISALKLEKPVLVAADYEPAAAGEMDWVSGYVLSHLMTANIPMVTLSTNVVGTAMLHRNLSQRAAEAGNYDLAANVLDLGYLPGGAVGMKAMAVDWRGTLPYTADFQPAWQQQLLLKVDQLSDFGAVLVLTDNLETARDWIEQVKPALGDTPLLMVLNAQSAPLVQPYYESGQVNGYAAGLSGALAYSQLVQQSAVTSSGYLSYQVALVVIALIILLGGLGHYALTSTSKGKNGESS